MPGYVPLSVQYMKSNKLFLWQMSNFMLPFCFCRWTPAKNKVFTSCHHFLSAQKCVVVTDVQNILHLSVFCCDLMFNPFLLNTPKCFLPVFFFSKMVLPVGCVPVAL